MNHSKITIAGKQRTLKATFANIVAIEADSGVGLISLVNKAIKAELTHNDVLSIIYNGLNGNAEDRLEKSQIIKEIEEKGMVNFYGPVSEFLTVSLKGGDEKKEPAGEIAS